MRISTGPVGAPRGGHGRAKVLTAVALGALLAARPAGGRAADAEGQDDGGLGSHLGLPRWLSPTVRYLAEAWGVLAGGRARGGTASGLLSLGAEVDLDRAGVLSRASLGVRWVAPHGGNISATVGDIGIVSNIAGVPAFRLMKAWVTQGVGDHLAFTAGILALDETFMVIEPALLFVNSGFGTPQTEALNTPAPIYPMGSLGAFGVWSPSERVDLRIGLYDGDAGASADHRFVGSLGVDADGGALLLVEVHLRPLGRQWGLSLGGFGHTGVLGPRAGRGLASGWVSVEGRLLELGGGTLEGFLRGAFALPEVDAVALAQLDGGLVWSPAVWGRPQDRLGVGVVSVARSSATLPVGRPPLETVFELTFRWQVIPSLFVQPDLQIVVEPAQAPDAGPAAVFGLRVGLEGG